jgi:hypothetical protein
VTFLISRATIFFSPESRALRAALAMRLDGAGQPTRRAVLRKDMDDSLADEKNVVEIDLYKSAFEIHIRG